jgi:cytidylate kinase
MKSEWDITTRISERQMRLWNALHPTEHSKNVPHHFITISPDEGSLGSEIAQALARSLGWQMYDKEIVNEIASNSHVREEMVRQLDEKSQGLAYHLILESIVDMFKIPGSSHFGTEDYHESLLKTLATIAARGDAVLVGRGANFALRWSEQGIHVRIVGSMEVRAQRFGKAHQLNPEVARQRLLAMDAERRDFIRYHFKQNYDDVRFYHAIFNTDHLSVEQAVGSILPLLKLENSHSALKTDLKVLNG